MVLQAFAIAIPRVLRLALVDTTLELRFLGYPVHPEPLQTLQSLPRTLANLHEVLELDLRNDPIPHRWHEVIGA